MADLGKAILQRRMASIHSSIIKVPCTPAPRRHRSMSVLHACKSTNRAGPYEDPPATLSIVSASSYICSPSSLIPSLLQSSITLPLAAREAPPPLPLPRFLRGSLTFSSCRSACEQQPTEQAQQASVIRAAPIQGELARGVAVCSMPTTNTSSHPLQPHLL